MASMEGVEATNDEATLCKLSAVRHKYYSDPFLLEFGCMDTLGSRRKAPEIHRGYFARVQTMYNVAQAFLSRYGDTSQIMNLGCGFDTLFWRLESDMASFVEVDLPNVALRKTRVLNSSNILRAKIGKRTSQNDDDQEEVHSQVYHLLGADLTKLPDISLKLHQRCGLNPSAPLLVLAECVLVYIEPRRVQSLLSWLTSNFSGPIVFLTYEQTNLDDRFGQIMLDNLSNRGCALKGASMCRNNRTQTERFIKSGFSNAQSWTMNEVYNEFIDRSEVERIQSLEHLDDIEVTEQLFQHYCFTMAIKNCGEHVQPSDFWGP